MTSEEIERLETRLVLEAIHGRYGYDFRGYSSDLMQRRVRSALIKSGLSHFGDLQHRLLTEPKFFASVLDDLTVQVTEMFRDPELYRVLRDRVLPMLRTYPQLKIWHAGCASGEEVYTTAILLSEENLYERTQIYATDMSASALEQAREGVYQESKVAQFTENYLSAGGKHGFEDYYSCAYGRIAMHERLRRNMVFFQHDLVSDYALGEMHMIFCRNVMIYFDTKLRERVLDMFARGLSRGGFLCLGSSECLPDGTSSLFTEFAPAQRIYRKRGES